MARRLPYLAVAAALVATLIVCLVRQRITDDELRERIAALLGVAADQVGQHTPMEMAGDHRWYIRNPDPSKDALALFSTCRGHMADYLGGTRQLFLRPPGYIPTADGKFTVDDARSLALRLAIVYWLMDAPRGARLTVTSAAPNPGEKDDYVVVLALEKAGRGAPQRASLHIDPGGRGCFGIYTDGWAK